MLALLVDHSKPVSVIVVARLPGLFYILYSRYFLQGKIFVSSELLASGHGILNHTPVLCSTVLWVNICGSPLSHENYKNFTPQKVPAIGRSNIA